MEWTWTGWRGGRGGGYWAVNRGFVRTVLSITISDGALEEEKKKRGRS